MAKLYSMILILIAIQASLLIFADQTVVDTVVWQFLMNLNQWGTLAFIGALLGIAGGIVLTGIAAASVFGFKTDFLIFSAAIAGLISIGAVFSNLAMVILKDLINLFFYDNCSLTNPMSCTPAVFIVGITIGPIALYYVWTVLEWWRGKDY